MKNKRSRLTHLPCPCGDSSDAFGIQDSGVGHCFSCGEDFSPKELEDYVIEEQAKAEPKAQQEEEERKKKFRPLPTSVPAKGLPERGITVDTLKRYKVTKDGDRIIYPLFDIKNNHGGNKIRFPNKQFAQEGPIRVNKAGLFGRHAFPAGSAKAITVTEGQDDAMAAFQMQGSKFPCVSVHSSSSAEDDCRRDFEYLNSFQRIYLCFDNDANGREAARKVANLPFPIGKIHIVVLRKLKDANDYLLKGLAKEFQKEWWDAPPHRPDGLKLGSEMWDEIINRKEHFTIQYPWTGLNEKTYGNRFSEFVVVTAKTGVGKTSVLKEIEHAILTNPEVIEQGYGLGVLHLEEPNGDTALGLISVHNSVPYHLPDSVRPEDDIRDAFNSVINHDRLVIWDHFGSNAVDAVLDKVRHMYAMGCRYIVIDHLSIIVSDQAGDERKQLDEIATKLKTLTMELDISVIAVIHTNRQGGIRGTAGVEQLANIVLRLERDVTDINDWRRNVTKVSVEKNRFCGFTGPAAYLFYNSDTGRLSELSDQHAALYEAGEFPADDEQAFPDA